MSEPASEPAAEVKVSTSTSTPVDSSLAEARTVMTRAALGATVLLVLKFALYEFSRSMLVGADALVTLVGASALAALALNLRGRRETDESAMSRPAILASSLSAWGVIIGGVVLVWRTVQHLFFAPPDAAEQIAEATASAEDAAAPAEALWVAYPMWAFWFEAILAVAGVVLLVYVLRTKGLLPGRGLGDAAVLVGVIVGVSLAAAVGLGVYLTMKADWFDAGVGLAVGVVGLGVLWTQVWKHFNRFVGSHPTTT